MKEGLYRFLRRAACHYLRRHHPYVIGITGSVGKTTCRMILSQVLRQVIPTVRFSTSPKNFNSQIGIVLAIFEIQKYTPNFFGTLWTCLCVLWKSLLGGKKYDVLLLEYGIDSPGDMDWLISIATPHMSVFTTLDLVHAQQLHDTFTILQEKAKLLLATKEVIFTAVQSTYLDPYLESIKVDRLTYDLGGTGEGDISYGTHYLVPDATHMILARFGVNQAIDKVAEVTTNLLGKEHAGYIALGVEMAMILEKRLGILKGISDLAPDIETFIFELQPGRYSVFPGQYGAIIVDSSYNGAPKSMKLTIENTIALRNEVYPDKELIYCLGDMRELGDHADKEHRKLATQVAQSADAIYLIGERMQRSFMDELEHIGFNTNRVQYFTTSQELGEKLLQDLPTRQKTAVILFKGSQNTIFLEEAIKPILKNAEDMSKLCRQGSRWMKRKTGGR